MRDLTSRDAAARSIVEFRLGKSDHAAAQAFACGHCESKEFGHGQELRQQSRSRRRTREVR